MASADEDSHGLNLSTQAEEGREGGLHDPSSTHRSKNENPGRERPGDMQGLEDTRSKLSHVLDERTEDQDRQGDSRLRDLCNSPARWEILQDATAYAKLQQKQNGDAELRQNANAAHAHDSRGTHSQQNVDDGCNDDHLNKRHADGAIHDRGHHWSRRQDNDVKDYEQRSHGVDDVSGVHLRESQDVHDVSSDRRHRRQGEGDDTLGEHSRNRQEVDDLQRRGNADRWNAHDERRQDADDTQDSHRQRRDLNVVSPDRSNRHNVDDVRWDSRRGHDAEDVPGDSYRRRRDGNCVVDNHRQRREDAEDVPGDSSRRRRDSDRVIDNHRQRRLVAEDLPVDSSSRRRRDGDRVVDNHRQRRHDAEDVPGDSSRRRRDGDRVVNNHRQRRHDSEDMPGDSSQRRRDGDYVVNNHRQRRNDAEVVPDDSSRRRLDGDRSLDNHSQRRRDVYNSVDNRRHHADGGRDQQERSPHRSRGHIEKRGADEDGGRDRFAERFRNAERNEDELPELFSVHRAKVQSIRPFGVFVRLEGFSKQGLVHLSQLSDHEVTDREDSDATKVQAIAAVAGEGDQVWVKVISLKDDGGGVKIGCSLKLVSQSTGKDLDPSNVKLEQQQPKGTRQEPKKVTLDAIYNVVCSRCGGHGHLKTECYGMANKSYELVPEEDDDPTPQPSQSQLPLGEARVKPGFGRGRAMVLPAWMTHGSGGTTLQHLGSGTEKEQKKRKASELPDQVRTVEEAMALIAQVKKAKREKHHRKEHRKHRKDKSKKSGKKGSSSRKDRG